MNNVRSFHFHALSSRLARCRPTVDQQLLGLAADLKTLALNGADPAELTALATWAELIAERIAKERFRD